MRKSTCILLAAFVLAACGTNTVKVKTEAGMVRLQVVTPKSSA